jgi:hypothetical protein
VIPCRQEYKAQGLAAIEGGKFAWFYEFFGGATESPQGKAVEKR